MANGCRRRRQYRVFFEMFVVLVAFVTMTSGPRSAQAIGVTFWNNPAGGTYENPQNWSDGLPGDGVFDLGGLVYQVMLKADAFPASLSIFSDEVDFFLNGATLAPGSFSIGAAPRAFAAASIQNGTLSTSNMFMGDGQFGAAACYVAGANTSLIVDNELHVGTVAQSILQAYAGAHLTVGSDMYVGAGDVDASGSNVLILNPGTSATIKNTCHIGGEGFGNLYVFDESLLQTSSVVFAGAGGVLSPQTGGAISVNGVIDAAAQTVQIAAFDGTLTCGSLQIGPGTSMICSVYMPGKIEVASGVNLTPPTQLAVTLADTNVVPFEFVGNTNLAGFLIVTLDKTFDPPAGTETVLMTTKGIEGEFDFVLLPEFPDDRVSDLAIEGGQIIYRVLGSSGGVILDPPIEFVVDGEPAVQDAGNVDTGAGFGPATNDIVVVIPDDDPSMNGSIQVFRNDGVDPDTGEWLGFTTNESIEVGREPSGVVIGEFNGDGFPDIAVSNLGDDTVTIFLNTGNGDGTFDLGDNVPVADAPSAIATGEFTEDGINDLVITGSTGGVVQLLAGDGVGGFTIVQSVDVGDDPRGIDPEDLDNDRCLDVAVVNTGSNSVSIVMNQSGTFVVTQEASVGLDPLDLALGDLDGDGDVDIATANNGDDTLSLLSNDGKGTFIAQTPLAVGMAPTSVEASDLTGDLAPELIVVADDPDLGPAVQVLENLGGLGFGAPQGFSVDADPNVVVGVDLDGDGVDDLVTANADDLEMGTISALISQPTAIPCPADVTGDGVVNVEDLVAVILAWGPCPDPPAECPEDIVEDGVVDVQDLVAVILNWGDCS